MNLETSFGRWLRARRRALDLTQDNLARQVGCAIITIQKLEADERRPSRQLAERLADKLMVASDDRAALISLARAEPYLDPESAEAPEHQLRAKEQPPSNLPTPLTRLIGRKHDIAAARNTLLHSEVRLLTLLGPPGIGKTRLSIAVAHEVQATFADGAYFVALAPLGDPALVLATIAQTLGIKEIAGQPLIETLKAALQAKRRLLLLDNFEHLLDAAPLVVELLEACPGLKTLITSRAALHVRGEQLYPVPPLLLPNLTQLPATSALVRTPAVALFVERAQAVLPEFRLKAQNAAAVAAICVRLNGLPLAIELAAARIKLLPPEGLLARLEQRLVLLTDGARDLPPRQRTLRAAIGWSYELLDAGEQALFARLGVFVGGCMLQAAEAVCNATNDLPMDATDAIASLLDKSLLQLGEGADGEGRFLMLETIREYALERLSASGRAEPIQRAHADYYLALAESAELQVGGEADKLWIRRLETEYPNLRAALAWSRTEADGTTGLRLVLALNWFWSRLGYLSEGRGWLVDILTPHTSAASRPNTADSRLLRAKALARLGDLAAWQSDLAAAQPALEESLGLFRELGDRWNIADTLSGLGMVVLLRGDYERSGALLEESLTLFRQLEDNGGIAGCFFFMGTLAYAQGNLNRAGELWEDALSLFRQLDSTWMTASTLLDLGILALDQGDTGRADAYLSEGLMLLRELGERWQVVLGLEACAGLAAAQGRQQADTAAGRRAARLFGAAEALRETLGAPLLPIYRDHYQRGVAAACAQLDKTTFAAAWAEGRAMTLEQAIAYALNATSSATTHSRPPP